MRIDDLVALYKKGVITQGELVFALGESVTPENVSAVMSQVPREFLPDIREWAFTAPLAGGVVICSNLSEQREREIRERVRQAIPALREWFNRTDAAMASATLSIGPSGNGGLPTG